MRQSATRTNKLAARWSSVKLPALTLILLALASALALALPAGASISSSDGTTPSSHSASSRLALLAAQQAKLIASDAAPLDFLGGSVALSGDTALVGAPYKTVGGKDSAGAAYVFTRSGTSWSQQAELTASDAATSDHFGCPVALSGDTALVGVPFKTVNGKMWAGAVYVFTRSGTSWSQQAEFSDPDAASLEEFGYSVALSGDTALVGALNKKTVGGKDGAGSVYVFTRSGTKWSRKVKLRAGDAATNDGFGSSVALSGNTALVGAEHKTVSGKKDAGCAYVFTRTGTKWSQRAKLTAADAAADDSFGLRAMLDGNTALVGAPFKTVGGKDSAGCAYVFTRTGTKWSQRAKLTAADAAADDSFGNSVALSGDTALVGAAHKTASGKKEAGAVYVFTRTGTKWSQPVKLRDPGAAAHEYFGYSVALSVDTALIGAPAKTVGGKWGAGAAYVDVLSSVQLITPKITLRPSGLKSGVVKLGKISVEDQVRLAPNKT